MAVFTLMSPRTRFFDSKDKNLGNLLEEVHKGEIVIPKLQRTWLWDDEKIKDLLASIFCGCPIGSFMSLECGNFKMPCAFVDGRPESAQFFSHNFYLLDGQQRLTALYQTLWYRKSEKTGLAEPTKVRATPQSKKSKLYFYYIDMKNAMAHVKDQKTRLSMVIDSDEFNESEDIAVNKNEIKRIDQKMIENCCFPTNRMFGSLSGDFQQGGKHAFDDWVQRFTSFHKERNDKESLTLWKSFGDKIIPRFKKFETTRLELEKDISTKYIFRMFEKSNSNVIPLDTFDLMVAVFTGQDHAFSLRDNWEKRKEILNKETLLDDPKINGLMFLRSLRLYKGLNFPINGVECSKVSLMDLECDDYKNLANDIQNGFINAAKFLKSELNIVYLDKDLSNPSQLIVWAAIMALINENGLGKEKYKKRLKRWYLCTALSRHYGTGGSTSKLEDDAIAIKNWLNLSTSERIKKLYKIKSPEKDSEKSSEGSARLPGAVQNYETNNKQFMDMVLYQLSNAKSQRDFVSKSIMALIRQRGAEDFKENKENKENNKELSKITLKREKMEVHHIFPKDYCKVNGITISGEVNILANLTPMYKATNISLGGGSPYLYIKKIDKIKGKEKTDEILRQHCIDPEKIRSWQGGAPTNDEEIKEWFKDFREQRQKDLLKMVAEELESTKE